MPAIGSRFPDFEATSVGTENQPSTPFPPKTNMTVAAGVVRYGIIGADVGQKNAGEFSHAARIPRPRNSALERARE